MPIKASFRAVQLLSIHYNNKLTTCNRLVTCKFLDLGYEGQTPREQAEDLVEPIGSLLRVQFGIARNSLPLIANLELFRAIGTDFFHRVWPHRKPVRYSLASRLALSSYHIYNTIRRLPRVARLVMVQSTDPSLV